MKNVLKVSISRMPFTIEEDAYAILKTYLDHLRRYYSGQQGGMEIVDGIEERIAELLAEQTRGGQQVVTTGAVNEVIETMGSPEIIEDADTEDGAPHAGGRIKKRLYRNPGDRVIGGVCSGLAAYFNIDPVIFRVLFVGLVLAGSISIIRCPVWSIALLVYLILWIIVPAAHTVEQKCAMRGEPFSAKNFEDSMYENGPSHTQYGTEPNRGRRFWHVAGRIVAVILGILFLLIAIPLILILISIIFAGAFSATALLFSRFFDWTVVEGSGNIIPLKILGLLILVLPLIGLIYGGCKLIFNFRTKIRLGLIAFLVWIASLIGFAVCFCVAMHPWDFCRHEKVTDRTFLPRCDDTLYLKLEAARAPDPDKLFYRAEASRCSMGWIQGSKKDLELVIFPEIQIVNCSADDSLSITVVSEAFGPNRHLAGKRAEEYSPPYEIRDSELRIEPYVIDRKEPWKRCWASINIHVPRGMTVVMQEPVYHCFGKGSKKQSPGLFEDFCHWD